MSGVLTGLCLYMSHFLKLSIFLFWASGFQGRNLEAVTRHAFDRGRARDVVEPEKNRLGIRHRFGCKRDLYSGTFGQSKLVGLVQKNCHQSGRI